MKTSDLKHLVEAIDRQDYESALSELSNGAPKGSPAGLLGLALSLVAAELLEIPVATRAEKAHTRLAELRQLFGANALQQEILTADVYLAAGLRQEASEHCRQLAERSLECVDAAHRLGLCELSRAMSSSLRNTPILIERWRRALAYLAVAAQDENYVRRWGLERLQVYGESAGEEVIDRLRQDVQKQLTHLLGTQKKAAESESLTETVQALWKLNGEFEVDQAAAHLMRSLMRRVRYDPPETKIPLPFGMLWYRAMNAPPAAREVLGEFIERGEKCSNLTEDGEVDITAKTLGHALRQWYSRLGPVRYALRWGRFEEAHNLLNKICNENEGCQLNQQPVLPRWNISPKCCGSNCPSFAQCNPGYAALDHPDAAMEEDAHRLGMKICAALAHCAVQRGQVGHIEAAEYWVRGRSMAQAIGVEADYELEIARYVVSHLEALADNPEEATELLNQALAAVPGATLRGCFVELLTERGINRCQADRWEEGSSDLRLAVRLNFHAERALMNLGLALQNLAALRLESRGAAAYETAHELKSLAEKALAADRQKEHFTALLRWANERLNLWHSLTISADEFLRQVEDGHVAPRSDRRTQGS